MSDVTEKPFILCRRLLARLRVMRYPNGEFIWRPACLDGEATLFERPYQLAEDDKGEDVKRAVRLVNMWATFWGLCWIGGHDLDDAGVEAGVTRCRHCRRPLTQVSTWKVES